MTDQLTNDDTVAIHPIFSHTLSCQPTTNKSLICCSSLLSVLLCHLLSTITPLRAMERKWSSTKGQQRRERDPSQTSPTRTMKTERPVSNTHRKRERGRARTLENSRRKRARVREEIIRSPQPLSRRPLSIS
ncbi:MAG: hypothetical protein BYD32DRAFT_406401 [Podila humilis]|nr:MAG: hypothetical protein BYD32DRAFT_406401 [Podila humilis]